MKNKRVPCRTCELTGGLHDCGCNKQGRSTAFTCNREGLTFKMKKCPDCNGDGWVNAGLES